MTVHVFGGISLPSCSNCALKKTVADNVKKYGEEVSFILRHNLYLDDMLKNFPSLHKVNSLCKKGGLNLIQFSSNHIELLKSIPKKYKKDGVKDNDLNFGF